MEGFHVEGTNDTFIPAYGTQSNAQEFYDHLRHFKKLKGYLVDGINEPIIPGTTGVPKTSGPKSTDPPNSSGSPNSTGPSCSTGSPNSSGSPSEVVIGLAG